MDHGSGYGGAGGYDRKPGASGSGGGAGGAERHGGGGSSLQTITDWSGASHFEKNFYQEHPAVTALTAEDIAAFRSSNSIVVTGRDPPRPCQTFEEGSFPDYILGVVEKEYGLKAAPTPVQAQAWPVCLSGNVRTYNICACTICVCVTHPHSHTHAREQTHKNIPHTNIHTQTHTDTHTDTHTHTYTHTHTHAHTHAHTHTRTHTRTHTHTYTHTLSLSHTHTHIEQIEFGAFQYATVYCTALQVYCIAMQ